MEVKPLTPLTHGQVLIVGAKASNFDDEIRNHPRVVIWDSQHESWTNKDLPQNVQAVFITRFIGHTMFGKIQDEAKKKHITIFNPSGTGIIIKQVRELLNLVKPALKEETKMIIQKGKLRPLISFIDFNKTNKENILVLSAKAKELGIQTTDSSLSQLIVVKRRKFQQKNSVAVKTPKTVKNVKDISVDMLDNVIKDLTELRAYLVATVKENDTLKQRIEKFKKVLDNE